MNIGILGLGTVGGGVVNVLAKNQAEIMRRTGAQIQVTHAAVRDINQSRICPTKGIQLTQSPLDIVNNNSIDIVLELMGGTTLAKELVETALKNGKHVITANKALIATHGNELLALAKDHNAQFIVRGRQWLVASQSLKALEQGMSANQIEMVAGIINGTGNFILTEMRDKGRDFADVLKEAQELGYAEADPTFDVEGIDAAHKLAILSAIAFGCELQFDKVSTQGISQISGEDVAFATELGYSIKHLGIAKKTQR
ncbi:Homoserine dehydrogenase (EC [uncultured Gammaproteobacteria bacterium]|nr:Homoserine dehydrogenase (EC [uncultured Gammaproteobacteria bacterium]